MKEDRSTIGFLLPESLNELAYSGTFAKNDKLFNLLDSYASVCDKLTSIKGDNVEAYVSIISAESISIYDIAAVLANISSTMYVTMEFCTGKTAGFDVEQCLPRLDFRMHNRIITGIHALIATKGKLSLADVDISKKIIDDTIEIENSITIANDLHEVMKDCLDLQCQKKQMSNLRLAKLDNFVYYTGLWADDVQKCTHAFIEDLEDAQKVLTSTWLN